MTSLRLLFGGDTDNYNRQAHVPRCKEEMYSNWRRANALALRFNNVFHRFMHETENDENENTLLHSALQAYRAENNNDFKLVECWQIVRQCSKFVQI